MNIQGSLNGQGRRFAVVTARFNDFVTERLLAGAVDALRRHGVADEAIVRVHVPGAFELPLAALSLAKTGKYRFDHTGPLTRTVEDAALTALEMADLMPQITG